MERDSHLIAFAKEFGFECIYASSPLELSKALEDNQVFVVFIESDFMPHAEDFMASACVKKSTSWVLLAEKLSAGELSRCYEVGYSDVLTYPVPFPVYKSRVLVFLDRWLQKNKFEAGTEFSKKLLLHLDRDHGKIVKLGKAFKPDLFISSKTFDEHKILKPQRKIILSAADEWQKTVENGFRLLENREDRESCVHKLDSEDSGLLIWTRGQKNLMRTELKEYSEQDRFLSVQYPEKCEDRLSFANFVREKAGEILYCNFNLDKGRFFFALNTRDLIYRANSFEFKIPDYVFRVQRRNEMRINMDLATTYNCELKMMGKAHHGEVFDVGSGGLRMKGEVDLLRDLKNRSSIVQVKLDLKNLEFDMLMRKRWSKNGEIGFEFVNLPHIEKERLRLYIFENMYDNVLLEAALKAG